MDLKQVADLTVQLTGRYDLMPPSFQEGVTSDVVDPVLTIVTFINSGIGLLEQLCPDENRAMFFLPTDSVIVVPRGRYIRKMYVGNPNNWVLIPRASYERIPIFSAITTKHLPVDLDTGRYMDVVPDDVGFNHVAYRLFFSTGGQALKVTGAFHPELLVAPNDTNMWCEKHPLLVAHAAAYQIETSYRNREGAAAWLQAINQQVALIEYDRAFDNTPAGWCYE